MGEGGGGEGVGAGRGVRGSVSWSFEVSRVGANPTDSARCLILNMVGFKICILQLILSIEGAE